MEFDAKDWVRVMEQLGSAPSSHTLPAVVPCLVCGGKRMTVFQDSRSPGTWHHCFDCKFGGDIVDLAALVWRTERSAAARKIARAGLGFAAGAQQDGQTWTEINRDLRACWETCRAQLGYNKWSCPNLDRLMKRIGIAPPGPRWSFGPGLMMGACAVQCLQPLVDYWKVGPLKPDHRQGETASRWRRSNVLVCPHYDYPGRIIGFSVIGRGGAARDMTFYAPNQSHTYVGIQEGGLAGWETLEASRQLLNGYALVVHDPFLAVRLQSRHIASEALPLPIVTYCDSPRERTHRGWACLGKRVPIFWAFGMSAATVHHARQTDGLVAMVPAQPNRQALDHYLRLDAPMKHAARALKRAYPWREALSQWCRRAHPMHIEELVMGLESYGELGPYQGVCDPIDKLIEIGEREAKRVRLYGAHIEERNSCWHAYPEGRPATLISNFTLRLRKPIINGYSGEVRYNGFSAPFEVHMTSRGEIDRRGFGRFRNILQRALLAKGMPAVLYVKPRWASRLFDIAILFGGLLP